MAASSASSNILPCSHPARCEEKSSETGHSFPDALSKPPLDSHWPTKAYTCLMLSQPLASKVESAQLTGRFIILGV